MGAGCRLRRLLPLGLQESQGLPGQGTEGFLRRTDLWRWVESVFLGRKTYHPAPGQTGLRGKGFPLLPQDLEPSGKETRLPRQRSRGMLTLGSRGRGNGSGDADVLCQILLECLLHGSQQSGGLGAALLWRVLLWARGVVPLALELEDPLHDPLRGLPLFRPVSLPAHSLQHQAEVHLERHVGRCGGRNGGFRTLLQQLQRYKGPVPLLLLRPGQQFLRKGLGQSAEGGQVQPLPGEDAHIRFCNGNGFHQKHPL